MSNLDFSGRIDERQEISSSAEKVVRTLLGVEGSQPSSHIHPARSSRTTRQAADRAPPAAAEAAAAGAPVQQLQGRALSQLSWVLSVLVNNEHLVLSADTRQLCYAVAEQAAQPGVMDPR